MVKDATKAMDFSGAIPYLSTTRILNGGKSMKRLMSGSLAMVLAMLLAAPAQADEAEGYPQQGGGANNWQEFKQDVKEAGRNIGKTGKEVGLGVADGAKKGGKAVKEFFSPDNGGGKGSSK